MDTNHESVEDVKEWFFKEISHLWPAGAGSLSLRRSPCIRKNCHVCETGEQHPSYVLYGRQKGKRFAVYVPDELAPKIKKVMDNGCSLKELLYEVARRYTLALKHERNQRK
jgi:hypothetical protein